MLVVGCWLQEFVRRIRKEADFICGYSSEFDDAVKKLGKSSTGNRADGGLEGVSRGEGEFSEE